jgi:hypothetical protein
MDHSRVSAGRPAHEPEAATRAWDRTSAETAVTGSQIAVGRPLNPHDPHGHVITGPQCPRCCATDLLEYDPELDLYGCATCANTWRVPADESEPGR